jgi:integrase
MGRIGKGVPVAEGIWRYKNGYRVQTKVHGDQKERWYSEDSDPNNLVYERARWAKERRKDEPAPPTHGFPKAVADYLTTFVPDSRRYQDADRQLSAWLPAFRKLDVTEITSQAIRAQLATWQAEDYAPSTLNHRRQELKNLFTYLYGKSGSNPVRDVPKIKETYDDARGQLPALVEAIFAEMEDSDTKLRLRVIWETSLPHADIVRLKRSQFHPKQKTIYVGDRHKGAGVKGSVMSLTSAGVDALTAFFDAGLEGLAFSRHSMRKSFLLAVGKAKAKWIGVWPAPENLRPYDLRHSRLTEALRHSKNLQGVQRLGRHKRLETTMRYVRALESESTKNVIDAMEGSRRKVPAAGVKNAKIARKPGSAGRRRS